MRPIKVRSERAGLEGSSRREGGGLVEKALLNVAESRRRCMAPYLVGKEPDNEARKLKRCYSRSGVEPSVSSRYAFGLDVWG